MPRPIIIKRARSAHTTHVCFPCRYTTKAAGTRFGGAGRRCPNCRRALLDCGTKFKAPKRTDAKRWRLVERLYDRSRPGEAAPSTAERDRQADWDARFELLNRLRRPKALSRRMMAVPAKAT
jgi:hypothetical protein